MFPEALGGEKRRNGRDDVISLTSNGGAAQARSDVLVEGGERGEVGKKGQDSGGNSPRRRRFLNGRNQTTTSCQGVVWGGEKEGWGRGSKKHWVAI